MFVWIPGGRAFVYMSRYRFEAHSNELICHPSIPKALYPLCSLSHAHVWLIQSNSEEIQNPSESAHLPSLNSEVTSPWSFSLTFYPDFFQWSHKPFVAAIQRGDFHVHPVLGSASAASHLMLSLPVVPKPPVMAPFGNRNFRRWTWVPDRCCIFWIWLTSPLFSFLPCQKSFHFVLGLHVILPSK